jgi:hypothetical protein
MMRTSVGIALVLLLAGCGAREPLQPPEGKALPPKPYGAPYPPNSTQLLTAPTQSRPARSDDPQSNQQRRSDEFDLPPPN